MTKKGGWYATPVTTLAVHMARSKPKPFKRQALFRFFVLDKAPIKHTVTIVINV